MHLLANVPGARARAEARRYLGRYPKGLRSKRRGPLVGPLLVPRACCHERFELERLGVAGASGDGGSTGIAGSGGVSGGQDGAPGSPTGCGLHGAHAECRDTDDLPG
jgi:hypothetical protein